MTRAEIVSANKDLVGRLVHVPPEYAHSWCWSCGYPAGQDLEQAHVVARSAGGGDIPRNRFLLCARCHREQPDGAERDAQIAWLLGRPDWRSANASLVDEAITRLGAEVPADADASALLIAWVAERGGDKAITRLLEEGAARSAGSSARTRQANGVQLLVEDFRAWLQR